MWVFALDSPFRPAEGFRRSGGGEVEDSSITQVYPHGSSVWQTKQRYNAAGDRRKRRVSGSISDTVVKIQTSSRQRQLAVPQPAPSLLNPLPPPLLGWQKNCTSGQKHHQLIHPQYLEGKNLFIFHRVAAVLPLFIDTPLALAFRCHA